MSSNDLIHSFKFDLTQLSKQPHSEVEDRVIRIFNQSFYSILNRISKRYASNKEIILDQLPLDLGGIAQEQLEKELPLRFEQALHDYFTKREKTIGEEKSTEEQEVKQHPLVFYLFNGVYPWYASQSEGFSKAWSKSIQNKNFIQQLYQHTWSKRAIRRLVQIGFSKLLEETLTALVPEEATFILTYHRELLNQHEKRELVKTQSGRSLHFIIWEFTLEFILNAKGSRFSKKEFVMAQLSALSKHYNLFFTDLLALFLKGINEFNQQNQQGQELYSILQELNRDYRQKNVEQDKTVHETKSEGKYLSIYEVEKMLTSERLSTSMIMQCRTWLVQTKNIELMKQRWLNPLKEKWLYRSVEIIVGRAGKEVVQGYHELLWKQQESITTETTTDHYKKAVWVFTLDFFAASFSSYFQARTFVEYHSRRIAQHFNVKRLRFLRSLNFAIRELAVSRNELTLLSHILHDLHVEERTEQGEETEQLNRQITHRLLNRMITEFKESVFHAEKEMYFFFENWAIRLIEEGRVSVSLPISFLLQLLKNKRNTPKSIIKALEHHQQYELEYTGQPESNYQLADIPLGVIGNFQEELSLVHFISGKKTLSFQLLQKLLRHEKQLSAMIVEKLQAAFNQKKLQQLFVQKWLNQLYLSEYQSLLKLLFGTATPFIPEVFKIIHFSFKNNSASIKKSYITYLFENKNKLNEATLWKVQLAKLSKTLNLNQIAVERQITTSIAKHSVSQAKYLSHFFF